MGAILHEVSVIMVAVFLGFVLLAAVAQSVQSQRPPLYARNIRLVGGSSPYEGRVEVLHNSQWGTICDDKLGYADARVVCRALGLSGGRPRNGATFGEGSGQIWLDDVDCQGYETSLESCGHSGWGNHDCTHGEDAGVSCDKPLIDANIRLVGGSSPYEGRVEVFHNSQWGTVCDDKFGYADARVVCRALGLSRGRPRGGAKFGPGSGPIWLDDVDCRGYETSLDSCQHRGWGSHDCNHSEDAGVSCGGPL